MLETNQWILLNALTYKIHWIADFDEMRLYLIQQLRYLMDFDAASFYMADPLNPTELTRPVGYRFTREDMQDYIDNVKKIDYSEGMMYSGKNIVYRESDILDDKIRVTTEYYRQVYAANHLHYSLHLNVCYDEVFLGVFSMFRSSEKPDFRYEDIFVLDMVKDHLALRSYQEYERIAKGVMTVSECARRFGLSPRETEVLRQLITTNSIEKIAEDLHIAVNTLKKHINSIYSKTGFLSRLDLHDRVRE